MSNDSFDEDAVFDRSDEETWELEDTVDSETDEDPDFRSPIEERSRRQETNEGYNMEEPGSRNLLPPFQPKREPGVCLDDVKTRADVN